jgi:hypothetical protein
MLVAHLPITLGPLELRQDFTPILGREISQFSFFESAQLPDLGNPWVGSRYFVRMMALCPPGGCVSPRQRQRQQQR